MVTFQYFIIKENLNFYLSLAIMNNIILGIQYHSYILIILKIIFVRLFCFSFFYNILFLLIIFHFQFYLSILSYSQLL